MTGQHFKFPNSCFITCRHSGRGLATEHKFLLMSLGKIHPEMCSYTVTVLHEGGAKGSLSRDSQIKEEEALS